MQSKQHHLVRPLSLLAGLGLTAGCGPAPAPGSNERSEALEARSEAASGGLASCSTDELSELDAACTDANAGSFRLNAAPLGSAELPTASAGTIHGVALPSVGPNTYAGEFAFTPSSDGAYQVYLGTPKVPLSVSADDGRVEPSCSRRVASTECNWLRRGDVFTLRAGTRYRFTLGPYVNTRWVRTTIRRQDGPMFEPARVFAAGTTPYYVRPADLDGDGALDLVVSTPDDASGLTTIDVLRNDSDGGFEMVRQISVSAPGETRAADFDRDGTVDIAGVAFDGQGPLPGFFLRGLGSFDYERTTWRGVDWLPLVNAGDFDEDGVPELVLSYRDSSSLDGPAGFRIVAVPAFTVQQDEIWPDADIGEAAAGDFDGDGHQDVVVASSATNSLTLYRGDGSGQVELTSTASFSGGGVRRLAIADLNADGRDDVAASNSDGTVTITYGQTTPALTLAHQLPAGVESPAALAAGDFNQDGRLDLAVGSYTEGRIALLLAGDSGFAQAGFLDVPDSVPGLRPRSVAAADLNADGRDDVVTTTLGGVAVFLSAP